MRSLFRLVLLVILAASLPAQVVEKPVPGDPVVIDSGRVAGKILDNGVKAYFGIPFAAPPVGNLRWREPQPVAAWKGVYNADRKMPECIQVLRPHNINHYFGEEATSENCLYLNLWAPANARAGAGLPVIVFLYGGGNTIGSSGMAIYGGENVAARGAIYVNFNYRVGAFGFLAHPELTKESPHHQSGNYAYLDQIAGLQWIQRNIAKFGGDPDKVIVSGQSAGAGAVSLLQASPLAKGLFRGVVAMSGSVWGNNGQAESLRDAEKTGLKLQEALKVSSIDDMRQIPADRILALQEEFQVGVRGGGPVRVGGANVDGYFLPQTPAELFAKNLHNDVPAVVGFTHDESSNIVAVAKTPEQYQAAANQLYGGRAGEFLKLYPDPSMGKTAAREAMVERSARNWAIAQTKSGKAPVYLYMYSRVHPYIEGAKIADQDTASIGAYHTSDVPYWFGTLESLNLMRPTRKWTEYDRDLSNKMMDTLIAFAKTGSPATSAVAWPSWKPQQEQLVEFGNSIQRETMNTQRLEFMRAFNPAPPTPRLARD